MNLNKEGVAGRETRVEKERQYKMSCTLIKTCEINKHSSLFLQKFKSSSWSY